jgi:hypothetical protein
MKGFPRHGWREGHSARAGSPDDARAMGRISSLAHRLWLVWVWERDRSACDPWGQWDCLSQRFSDTREEAGPRGGRVAMERECSVEDKVSFARLAYGFACSAQQAFAPTGCRKLFASDSRLKPHGTSQRPPDLVEQLFPIDRLRSVRAGNIAISSGFWDTRGGT